MTDKLRREKVNLMLTSEERKQILDKAKKYGYGNKISDYAREACLNERFYIEEIKGKKEICESANKYALEVRKYSNKLDMLSKKPTLSASECEEIITQSKVINNSINQFIKDIISQLSIFTIQKFQKRLRLIEKNEVSKKFIDKVIKKKIVLAVPSTLTIKNINDGATIIFLNEHESYEIKSIEEQLMINYSAIGIFIDEQREMALQKDCYLFFRYEDNRIHIYLAKFYNDVDNALKMFNKENMELYICKKEEG